MAIVDIDWLTIITYPEFWLDYRYGDDTGTAWRPRAGGYGYRQGWVNDVTGLIRLTDGSRPGMDTCYIASATTLAALAAEHGSASYLFGALSSGLWLGRATRLDVRVDIEDGGLAIHDMRAKLYEGVVGAPAKRRYVYEGVNGTSGLTIYLGSKTAQSYVRCYDKNAESHGSKPYSRVEVQLRGKRANQVWSALHDGDQPSDYDAVIRGVIARHVGHFGVAALDSIINGVEPFEWNADPAPDKDVKRWLMTQVLPTFVRDALSNDGHSSLMEWFIEKFNERLHPGQ